MNSMKDTRIGRYGHDNRNLAGLAKHQQQPAKQAIPSAQPDEQISQVGSEMGEEGSADGEARKLAQRQKQIDYGKNTLGYQRYLEQVPKDKRRKKGDRVVTWIDPKTPDINQDISKRAFDGQIKVWRRALHKYDPNRRKGGDSSDEEMEGAARRQKAHSSAAGYKAAPAQSPCGSKRGLTEAFDDKAGGPSHKLMRSPASRSRFGHRDADSAGQEHAGSHRSGSGGGTSASGTAGGQGLSGCTRAGSGLWPEETLAESAAAAAAAATAAMAGAKSKAAAAAASAAFQRVPVTAAASKVVPARVASAGVAAPDGTRWSDIVDDDEEQIELDYVGL